jgi:hypothetical protein
MSELTVQPSSKDNALWKNDPNTNYGTLIYIITYAHASDVMRSLVEFPVVWGTDIPAGATITSAKLRLYYYNYGLGDPVGRTINVYRLLRLDWHETQSTWNIFKTSNNWTTAGAGSDGNDHTTINGANAVVPASYGWMEWDITEQVKTAQTGNVNVACLIKDSNEVASSPYYQTFWYSREYATNTTLRPKLVVIYTAGEAKTSGDSGAGVESTCERQIGATETGAGAEAGLATAAVISGDGGSGSEVGGLLKALFSQDKGGGADSFKILTGKAGYDLRLHSNHGQVSIPHKEVNL